MKIFKLILAILAIVVSFVAGMFFRQEISNIPVVKVVRVYDGDTIIVDIPNWPPIIGEKIPIRIRGIDTPELHDASVQSLAKKAKDYTSKAIASSRVELKNLTRDKYFRIDADVYVNGKNLADLLVKEKLAKKYDGGKKPIWK